MCLCPHIEDVDVWLLLLERKGGVHLVMHIFSIHNAELTKEKAYFHAVKYNEGFLSTCLHFHCLHIPNSQLLGGMSVW